VKNKTWIVSVNSYNMMKTSPVNVSLG